MDVSLLRAIAVAAVSKSPPPYPTGAVAGQRRIVPYSSFPLLVELLGPICGRNVLTY